LPTLLFNEITFVLALKTTGRAAKSIAEAVKPPQRTSAAASESMAQRRRVRCDIRDWLEPHHMSKVL
jgi:hypothetical protein